MAGVGGGSRADSVDREFCERLFERLPSMFSDPGQLHALEEKTREQSRSRAWHDHRQGRLTASIFGDVMAHVRSKQPSPSLLQKVKERGTTRAGGKCPPAIKWGMEKEKEAIDM